MSNSQNKKNEQQNNLCTTLTEQWKKGELESGWYYVNFYSVGAVMQEYLPEHNGFGYDEKNLIQEVLAPVPSYEEWQQLHKFLEEFNALEVAEENQQLKELIKEIRSLWKGTICMPDSQEQVRDILIKIDNVIGEKK